MKLVSDWKRAWRWHSTQIAAIIAALPFVWASLPADLKAHIPDAWLPYIAAALAIALIVGRVRDQK